MRALPRRRVERPLSDIPSNDRHLIDDDGQKLPSDAHPVGHQWFLTEGNGSTRCAFASAFDELADDVGRREGFTGTRARVAFVGASQGAIVSLDAVASARWKVGALSRSQGPSAATDIFRDRGHAASTCVNRCGALDLVVILSRRPPLRSRVVARSYYRMACRYRWPIQRDPGSEVPFSHRTNRFKQPRERNQT
jgi:hypothetical protein